MKKTILLLLTCLTFKCSFAQIEKRNWLVGGSGSFASETYTYEEAYPKVTSTELILSPNVGFFIIDKLAIGTLSTLAFSNLHYYNDPSFKDQFSRNYLFGIFAKYYYFKQSQSVNLFSELGYYIYNTNNSNNLWFSAGPVVFLNPQTGLEFKVNYRMENMSNDNHILSVGLGLQIHLKKN